MTVPPQVSALSPVFWQIRGCCAPGRQHLAGFHELRPHPPALRL